MCHPCTHDDPQCAGLPLFDREGIACVVFEQPTKTSPFRTREPVRSDDEPGEDSQYRGDGKHAHQNELGGEEGNSFYKPSPHEKHDPTPK